MAFQLYLHLENIKAAVAVQKFALVQVGFYRNEELAAKANPARQNFIAQAVDQLRSSSPLIGARSDLLAIWTLLPEAERLRVDLSFVASYFQNH